MSKGSAFEREFCKTLSLWWTYGARDDVFWRTSGSGARAKTRSKSNQSTFGQHGDVQATDPTGQKLIDLCSIELKRGYSKNTFAELLDKPDNAAEQAYEAFIRQAKEHSINANARTWMLVVKRDRRKAVVFIPLTFYCKLLGLGCALHNTLQMIKLRGITKDNNEYKIIGFRLNDFLDKVRPSHIKRLLKTWKINIDWNVKKESVDDDKLAQIFKCINCEEEAVVWESQNWRCQKCGTTYSSKELGY